MEVEGEVVGILSSRTGLLGFRLSAQQSQYGTRREVRGPPIAVDRLGGGSTATVALS